MNQKAFECKHEWICDWPWETAHLKDWFYMVSSGGLYMAGNMFPMTEPLFLHVRVFGLRSVWTVKLVEANVGLSSLGKIIGFVGALEEMSRNIAAVFGVPPSFLEDSVIGIDRAAPGTKDKTVLYSTVDGVLNVPATEENIQSMVDFAIVTGNMHVLTPELIEKYAKIAKGMPYV